MQKASVVKRSSLRIVQKSNDKYESRFISLCLRSDTIFFSANENIAAGDNNIFILPRLTTNYLLLESQTLFAYRYLRMHTCSLLIYYARGKKI